MHMHISADIPLSEPNVDEGLITWFSVEIFDDVESDDEHGDVSAVRIGRARVARIHVGHALDSSAPLTSHQKVQIEGTVVFARRSGARRGKAKAWAAKEDAKGYTCASGCGQNTRDGAAVQDGRAEVVEGHNFGSYGLQFGYAGLDGSGIGFVGDAHMAHAGMRNRP